MSEPLTTNAIIVIVVSVIFVCLLIAAICIWYSRRNSCHHYPVAGGFTTDANYPAAVPKPHLLGEKEHVLE